MKTQPRFQENLTISGLVAIFTTGWKSWFQEVYNCLGGWSASFAGSGTIDFGNIPFGSELSGTVTVSGVAVGDKVNVYPMANVEGLVFIPIVTAADTITVYAKNFSLDFVDPATVDFKFTIYKN